MLLLLLFFGSAAALYPLRAGPIPSYAPSYRMNDSTALMVRSGGIQWFCLCFDPRLLQICNYTDWIDPVLSASFAWIDIDWSNVKGVWAAQKARGFAG